MTPDVDDGPIIAGRYLLDEDAQGHDQDAGLPGVPGEDLILGRLVRVHVLDPHDPASGAVLDAARRAALVHDQRLVPVLDVGRDDEHAWVVTDDLRGSGLDELCEEGPLTVDDARAVIGEAASALESANRHGVHHLELTPAHVRVTRDGEVLVVGVGLHAALHGEVPGELDILAAARQDATDLVRLLHLALTGVPAPAHGALPAVPYPADVPRELRALCERTLVDDEPPVGPASIIRALAPWRDVAPASPDAGKERRSARTLGSARLAGVLSRRRADGDVADEAPVDDAPVDDDTLPAAAAPAARPAAAPPAGPVAVQAAEPAAGPDSAVPAPAGAVPAAVVAESVELIAPEPVDTEPIDAAPATTEPATPDGDPLDAFDGDADLPADATRPSDSRAKLPTRIGPVALLAAGLVAVLVLLGLALSGMFDGADRTAAPGPTAGTTAGTAEGAATDEPAPTPTPTAPPVIGSLTLVDPGQRYPDHPEDLGLATDGNPRTAWRSLWYDSPTYAGVKDGAGIVVTLDEPAVLTSVTLDVRGTGGRAQLLSAPPGAAGSTVLAEGDVGPDSRITLPEPVVLDEVVVWFDVLPRATENGRNMVALHELAVH